MRIRLLALMLALTAMALGACRFAVVESGNVVIGLEKEARDG